MLSKVYVEKTSFKAAGLSIGLTNEETAITNEKHALGGGDIYMSFNRWILE